MKLILFVLYPAAEAPSHVDSTLEVISVRIQRNAHTFVIGLAVIKGLLASMIANVIKHYILRRLIRMYVKDARRLLVGLTLLIDIYDQMEGRSAEHRIPSLQERIIVMMDESKICISTVVCSIWVI